MPVTRFDICYNQISEQVDVIRRKYDYQNDSKAFGHWYLSTKYRLSDEEIQECLIDGYGDNGIDAYIFDESQNSLKLIQFKFPIISNSNKMVKESDIQKMVKGCRIIMAGSTRKKCSEDFIEMLEAIKEMKVYKIVLEIVAFNNGLSDNANEELEEYKRELKASSGTQLTVTKVFRNDLCSLFEKSQHSININIELPYRTGIAAYNIGVDIESYLCMVNAQELVESIGDNIIAINDENIRLFEGDSRINDGIKNTASTEEGKYFYFYNNGITLICDEYHHDATKRILDIRKASIVNGCQTVTCLYDLNNNGSLNNEVTILVRVISTTDYELRGNITEYLNSQNPIKDSYFLANNVVIRSLQEKLIEEGFYLDRQQNEYINRLNRGLDVPKDVRPIELSDAIQYYVGYCIDENAALAKGNKKRLFSKDKIHEILSNISAQKVAKAWKTHEKVCKVLTKYRKLRRNHDDKSFSEFMNIDQAVLLKNIDSYRFLNTADILLLNTIHALLINGYRDDEIDDLIRMAVTISHNVIESNFSDLTPANATKNSSVFDAVNKAVRMQMGNIDNV